MATWTLKLGNTGLFDFLHRHKPVVAAAGSRQVGERRAAAMRGFFPKLSAWLAHHSYLAEMRETERYLSQSSDIFDLERRIRRIESGVGTFRLD